MESIQAQIHQGLGSLTVGKMTFRQLAKANFHMIVAITLIANSPRHVTSVYIGTRIISHGK